jgi:hypothetical protein
MDPRIWARISIGLALLFFAGMLARSFYLEWHIVRSPCADLSVANDTGAAPSVVDFSPKNIGLGSPLCVAIAGVANFVTSKDGKPTLHLFLDGQELKASVGRFFDRKTNLVLFDVARTGDDGEVWRKIIGQPGWGSDGSAPGSAHVRLGAGTDAGEFERASLPPLELRIVDPWALILGLIAFVAAVFALVLVARESAILRDGDAHSTYSLGRVQMAFWLYLVTAGFAYVWLATGDYNGILTSQSLTLLGISGTTALMAIAVKDTSAPVASVGFWKDILSDASGAALHRLQIVVWTAILGVIFLAEIYNSFRLPTFDSNLLILMGISGLTYVGFKFNEK